MERSLVWLLALLFCCATTHAATHTIDLALADFTTTTAVTSSCGTLAPAVVEQLAVDGTVDVTFTDTSGFTTVSAVSIDVSFEMTSTSIGAVDLVLNGMATGSSLAAQSCPPITENFSIDASFWQLNAANTFTFSATEGVIDLVAASAGAPVVTFTITGDVGGGGSDPYIYSPHVQHQGMELVASLTREGVATRSDLLASPTSLLLVDAAEASLSALLGDGSVLRADSVYFTAVTLEVAGASPLVLYTQMTDDGRDGTLAVSFAGQQQVCSRDDAATFTHVVGDEEVRVTVECGAQWEAYEASRFMMRAWPFQADATHGRVVVEGATFRAEVFYMQQNYVASHGRWVTGEPFGFFNIHTMPVNGGHYTGVFGTDLGTSARQAMEATASPAAASAHFLASYLQ